MNRHQLIVGALGVLGLLDRRAQRPRLEHDREQQDGDADADALDLVRVAQLLDSLEEREQPAHENSTIATTNAQK